MGHCYACDILYCSSCQQDNVCSSCSSPLVLTENGTMCECPYGFILNGGNLCICPPGQLQINQSCIPCAVENCLSCSTTTTCDQCLGSYTLSDNQTLCLCTQTTLSQQSNCICPPYYTKYQDICYLCTIPYCLLCI